MFFIGLTNQPEHTQEGYYANPFKSGIWLSRYYQYGEWHGPHQFSLTFDQRAMKTTGSGTDDIGTFTIHGIYSLETQRIGLTKLYQSGTDNPSENLGHQVIIQLTWNTEKKKFEGKWYVQKKKISW